MAETAAKHDPVKLGMAQSPDHERHDHQWTELRRQIPWHPSHFDKAILSGGERPKDANGQPYSDDDWHATVADPQPEVVFICTVCSNTLPVPIPKAELKRVVDGLESGALTDDPANHPGAFDIGKVPLSDLFPSLAEYETAPRVSPLEQVLGPAK